MKFRYAGPDVGPIALTDLSSSISAGPAGINFVNIVSQNQLITHGNNEIELQDSDEVVKSYTSGQLRELIDAGTIVVDVTPGGFEFNPEEPADWQVTPPTNVFEALNQAADIASSYRDGTAAIIRLVDGSNIGDATHRIGRAHMNEIAADSSFVVMIGAAPVVSIDAVTFTIDQSLAVTGNTDLNSLNVTGGAAINSLTVSGLADVNSLKVGLLDGILKAASGVISGSATLDDIPDGLINKHYNDVMADARITLQKAEPLGLATLDADGYLPINQLPPGLRGVTVYEVSSESTMLGLFANIGDTAIRDDVNRTFILKALPPTNINNWKEIIAAGTVFSVNGKTETVVLTTTDINEGTRLYFTNERVDDRVAVLLGQGAGDIAWTYDDNLGTMSGIISLATKTTDNLDEGIINKYFTDERVDDRVAAFLVAGDNVQLTHNDASNIMTISVDLTGSVLLETIDDRVSQLLVSGGGITWTYNDSAGTLSGSISLASFTTDDLVEGLANEYFTHDRVGESLAQFLVAGTNIEIIDETTGPNQNNLTRTFTINATMNAEAVNDTVADLIDNSATITWSYNGSTSLVGTVLLTSFTTNDLVEGSTNLYYTQTRVDDRIYSLLGTKIVGGNNIDVTSTLPGGVITISSVFTGPNTFEEVDDRVAALIQNGTGLTWVYNDGTDGLVGNISLSPFTTDDLVEGLNLYYTPERVDDRVAALLQAGNNIIITYNDNGLLPGSITIDALFTGPNSFEDVDDRVASLIQNGTGLSWTYDDNAGTLTGVVNIGAFNTTQIPEGVPYYDFDEFNNPTTYHPGLYFTPSRAEGAVFNMTTVQNATGAGTKWRVRYPQTAGPYLETSTPRPTLSVDLDIQDGPGITWNFHTYTQSEPFDSAQATINLSPFTTDNLAEGTTNKYFTTAGLAEAIDDRVAALLVAGPGIILTYNDSSNQLQITANLAAYDDEQARDAAAAMFQPNTGITWTYNDTSNTMTPTINLGAFTSDDLPEGTTNLYMSLENVDDRVAALILNGTGLDWVYNDASNSLVGTVTLAPFSTDDLQEGINPVRQYYTDEKVDDRVALLIQNGPGITWNYDDTNGLLTPTVSLGVFSSDDIGEGVINLYYTDERVDDRVSSLIQNGTGLAWTYNDNGTGVGTLTANVSLAPFSTTDLAEGAQLYYTDERVDDRVAALLVAGDNITISYDDNLGTLTVASTASGGGDSSTLVTVTSTPYTALSEDGVILVDASAITDPSIVVNLPTAVGIAGKK